MSIIAVPPPPRPASRAQGREGVTGSIGGHLTEQTRSRPRLRLVTDDFIPEIPLRRVVDDAKGRSTVPSDATSATSPELLVRRPSRPASVRGRRPDLEKLAPQHPAVRAARMHGGARRDSGPQIDRETVVARSQRQEQVRRTGIGLHLIRGGAFSVAATIVLTCCGGFMLGGLAGLAAPAPTVVATPETVRTATTVVLPGQSLWEIAAGSGTSDVSAMVARIVELNDLESPTVHAGQTLKIPVG